MDMIAATNSRTCQWCFASPIESFFFIITKAHFLTSSNDDLHSPAVNRHEIRARFTKDMAGGRRGCRAVRISLMLARRASSSQPGTEEAEHGEMARWHGRRQTAAARCPLGSPLPAAAHGFLARSNVGMLDARTEPKLFASLKVWLTALPMHKLLWFL